MMKKATNSQIVEQIKKKRGNLAAVGRCFGLSRMQIWRRIQKSKTLQQATLEARETQKDNTESKLFKAIDQGEAWAICFYLKTQAKDRGYVERVENTGKDGGPMEMEVSEREKKLNAITDRLAKARSGVASRNGVRKSVDSTHADD